MTIGLTDSQYYSDIADAIRAKRTDLPSNTTFSPSQMAAAISGISGSGGGSTPIPTPTPYHWVRPSEWPDLDSVYNGEKNTIWMTVDATGRFEYPCVSFSVSTNPSSEIATIQIGTITNGVFTVTATETRLHNQNFTYEWTPSTGFYPVIKVTANGIKNINFGTATTIVGTKELYPHIIECIGHADYAFTKTPLYVAHEAIGADLCPSNTFLSNRWQGCYRIESLDLSGWNTENWGITSLYQTWYYCYSLKELDLSGWDTTNWAVTTLASAWSSCVSLISLDLSSWDTTNWAVTSLNATWSSCQSLKELDLSGWDTTNWVVTNVGSAWSTSSLIDLKLPQNFFGSYTGTNAIYFSSYVLSRASILSIFNALSTISSSNTINIGSNNKNKMTAEEIAIATNKGWTVS